MSGRSGNECGGPDRDRWNTRYRRSAPTFSPHPLVGEALVAGLPDGPVLELACGRSGSALALAEAGRSVIAVDVSDVALEQLRAEAHGRGLAARIECVHSDAASFGAAGRRFALVLATLFWDVEAFRAGCRAVAPGGVLAWEALAADEPRRFHLRHGDLGALLPDGWDVLTETAVETTSATGARRSTRLLARRS